eukprot:TRINITY_DN3569_c0_g1_i1.p1 TRINITY_DN3569_c0_g1~~TRINITY_DN3569_c0_g1_i1.p1  ORF type:complete len:280 (-),score=56.87 TRINITY_DN3569_c0_g1_i1:271-1110(-)
MGEGGEGELSLVKVERDTASGVVVITINRPKALNALTRGMMTRLAHTFHDLGQDSSVKAIILTGAGRAFCAGVDLTVAKSVFKGDVKTEADDLVVQMERCPVPIIGAINGHAITAGFEIALACDILIASTEAKFADTHSKFGIFPSWGLSQKLPRLIGVMRARHVSLSAMPIDATSADRWGLVSQLVAPNELMDVAKKLALTIAGNHQEMVRRYKAVINDGMNLPLGDARILEKDRAHAYYSTMKEEDFDAMQKFIAGRSKPGGGGAAKRDGGKPVSRL